ncbi:MAG: FAD-dependent thymidylate synthase [Syntrophales bacterium]|jgi:flavin-dependent thymidylate synthase|nr:FAD-dependent thymidylate synthase [Syntrophales bacterium]
MKIILAGCNVDYETILDAKDALPDSPPLTPETISAAYARISRSPKSVETLRTIARMEVEKARQSNQSIVFEMGHSSIAEHAVFNIDIIAVSRLLAEEIEKFRLCSYTEKSQRYVLLSDDFVIPEEIRAAGLVERFKGLVQKQNAFYHTLYGRLRPFVFAAHPDLAKDSKNRGLLEGWAKEDARYILSMATQTQLGMTLNARNLELVVRRMAAHPLKEANEYGRKLYEAVKSVAPSLIRYTEKTDCDARTRTELKSILSDYLTTDPGGNGAPPVTPGHGPETEPVKLIHVTPGGDERLLAAFIHGVTNRDNADCLKAASTLTHGRKEEIFRTAFRHMKSHDAAPRELECVDFIYELIVSAGCFAQLKRHRMATILSQNYDPALGVTIPESIREIGMAPAFRDMIALTEDFYGDLLTSVPDATDYCLTNAHRKRVLMKINARELYHMARLRTDRHAQWDIRNLTREMLDRARMAMPLTLLMATGKDDFEQRRREVFDGTPPLLPDRDKTI